MIGCPLLHPDRHPGPTIKGAQRFGLRLSDVGELLGIMDRGQCPCGHTEKLLRQRIAEIDSQLQQLGRLRSDLAGFVDDIAELRPAGS